MFTSSSFEELIVWSRLGQPEKEHLLDLVEAAFDDLDEDDPRYAALVEIENALLDGELPIAELLQLGRDFPPAMGHLPAAERLELEYRVLAAALPRKLWPVRHYVELERVLLHGSEAELERFVQRLRASLDENWQAYCRDYGVLQTNTAETLAGHLLLTDAYESWLEALDLAEEGARPEEVLSVAEFASRLLVAVEILDRNVKQEAGASSIFRTRR